MCYGQLGPWEAVINPGLPSGIFSYLRGHRPRALDGRTSDGPTTPNIGTGIRCMVDRTAFYKRGPLDAPSTRHRGHKNKPLILVAELEADAVF